MDHPNRTFRFYRPPDTASAVCRSIRSTPPQHTQFCHLLAPTARSASSLDVTAYSELGYPVYLIANDSPEESAREVYAALRVRVNEDLTVITIKAQVARIEITSDTTDDDLTSMLRLIAANPTAATIRVHGFGALPQPEQFENRFAAMQRKNLYRYRPGAGDQS